jgi:hypothetical protein
MYFDHDVVARMITDLQYTRIMKVSGAKQCTSELVRDAVELKSVLAQYPQIRYEPLDYHYVLLKYLAAFDVSVLADLCSGAYSWRGIVIAGWLASLSPSNVYIDHLSSVSATAYPHNFWFIRLAIAEANQERWTEDTELQDLVVKLRTCLAPISLPSFSLRRAPSLENLGQMAEEHEAIKMDYQARAQAQRSLLLRQTKLKGQSRNDL